LEDVQISLFLVEVEAIHPIVVATEGDLIDCLLARGGEQFSVSFGK
jgi:hypothetical protein